MTALEAIFMLRQQRRDKRIHPDHVPESTLFGFLDSCPPDDYKKQLNEAYRQGKIIIHRTLNGRSIELID